jgi:hypothetical protein
MLDARLDTTSTLRTPEWYTTATRWTQLTLAEDDPVKFDPDWWIELFRRTRSNAACLSAGGYIAYYPSKVPFHYVSKFIGDGDPFGRLVEGARSQNMHVMARVDPHAIHQDAADAHPEWIAVDKDGNRRRHWAFPEVWVTCAYGSYNAEYMPEVVKEIVRAYDIDAIFANRWQGHGVCYCASCREKFGAFSGHDLPMKADAADPGWRDWTAWRRQVLTRTVVEWDEAVKAIRPHASFIPNMGGASLMEFDLKLIEKHCPFLVVDDQGRRGLEAVWKAGRNAKRMRATFRERPVILITSVGPEEAHRWKDSVTTGPEITAWMVNGATHGMRPWFTKFNGVVPDDRWVQPVVDAFALHAAMEPVLHSMQPTAEIAILDPSTTLRHWASEDRHIPEAGEYGFYHALVEAKLPFEFLSDMAMMAETLDRFRVVILANATCLSDAQCEMLRAYVARGGALVASGAVASCDENNRPRPGGPALADLFGATVTRPERGPVKNTYIALGAPHRLNEGFGSARRIIAGTRLIGVEALEGTGVPFRFVPDFPDLPMEEVYPREQPRDPGAVVSEGKGRTVWFPWNLGEVFWEVLTADHQVLIENAVRWALGGRPRVEVAGKSVLDIALREDGEGLAVLMFNLTNPHMLKGPAREIWPVGPHHVSVRLPAGRTGAAARLMASGRALPVTVADGRAEVEVPGIDVQDVLHLAWT